MRKKMYVEVIEPKSIALTKKQDKWVITYVERDESGDNRQERVFFVDVKINPPREKGLTTSQKALRVEILGGLCGSNHALFSLDLLTQGGAISAEVCDGNRQLLSANQNRSNCAGQSSIFENVVESKVTGSSSLLLRAKFNLLTELSSVWSSLAIALLFVCGGFYSIQRAQRRIRKDLFDPLLNQLLSNEPLEIHELNQIRKAIQEVKSLEAEKAVNKAIRENNQQVAHDIRSPIQSISALLQLASIKDEGIKNALDKSVLRAVSVANFLLRQEKITTVSTNSETSYNLAKVIEDIVIEKRPLFEGGKITFSCLQREDVQTELSLEILSRILSNIVDNAIQASEARKHIEITLSIQADFAIISILDSGRGIAPEIFHRIGEKGFSHRDGHSTEGSGRGVYSAKSALIEIGGDIQFSTRNEGGTAVTIKVPISAFEYYKNSDFVLIDDEPINRMSWQFWARENGYILSTFSDYKSFLKVSDMFPRSIPVFVDFHMANSVTAITVVPIIRSHKFDRIFLATGSFDNEDCKQVEGVLAIIGKDPNDAQKFLPLKESFQLYHSSEV